MGASQSKSHASASLDELSADDVSNFVMGLGGKYKVYGEAITSNAVDGEILASLDVDNDEEAVKETFECLEITNFLHRRVLVKEWKKAKAAMMMNNSEGNLEGPGGKKQMQLQLARSETGYTLASDITTETADMTAAVSSMEGSSRRSVSPLTVADLGDSGSSCVGPDGPPLTISLQHKQALEALELPQSLDLLPADSKVLDSYRETATHVRKALNAKIGAVNLLSTGEGKGVNSLATVVDLPDGTELATRLHFDQPEDMEICRSLLLTSEEDFHVIDIPEAISQANGMSGRVKYYGYVVKHGGLRVGTVCVIVLESRGTSTTTEEKRSILKSMAKVTEKQLDRRKVLLQRTQNLKYEIEQLKKSQEDCIVAPAQGQLKVVLASQIASRQVLFPYPEEPELTSEDGCPTRSEFTRRSATLASWLPDKQANEEERLHLGPEYYKTMEDGFSTDQTPVGQLDMDRVAMLNALALTEIDPLADEAKNIQSLCNMGGTLLDVDFVLISLADHQYAYSLFPTFVKGVDNFSKKTLAYIANSCETIALNPDGSPFCCRGNRAAGICNYSLMTPGQQSFVVHDVARDESLYHWKTVADVGFYSGAPIIVRGQPVGSLCCMSTEARPNFGRVQEVQLEQFANLIAQQLESWALSREMKKLELERRLLLGNCLQNSIMKSMRASPPEEYAALVFTNVEGLQALQESSPEATKLALTTHKEVVRTAAVNNSGYEVNAEGNSFYLAFADVVDAVNFCLQAQEGLQAAQWAEDILALSEACEDPSGSMRGLRVRMVVHCGEVESTKNQQSGQVEYTGDTVHVAKNLERMCHGGQILVTSDVWSIVSHLVENSLESVQVMDLGSHVIPTHSAHVHDGITTKTVLQLVPSALSHDYLCSRRLASEQPSCLPGRVFPSLLTAKSLGASFRDAPFADNRVTMVSVDTSKAETIVEDSTMLLAALSKRIGALLAGEYPTGYQCQDNFLLAFGEIADAVQFGLELQAKLENEVFRDLSLKGCLKIGIHEGVFDTMGPNPKDGKAEYVGQVVTAVSRIAKEAAPGCVYLGRVAAFDDAFMLQPVTNGYMQEFKGQTALEGIPGDFSLFKCQPCTSWYDQVKDKRTDRRELRTPWRGY